MAILTVLQTKHPILSKKSESVPDTLFGAPELSRMIADMAETLDQEQDGVAIAAPQVGIPYRIFLVRYDRMLAPVEDGHPARPADVGVFINPEFVKLSQRSVLVDEGCLSVRGLYGKTKRKTRASVRAKDEAGNVFERGAGGLLAQAFQHEMDHLNGILFIDHATDIVEVREEDRAARRKEREERRRHE